MRHGAKKLDDEYIVSMFSLRSEDAVAEADAKYGSYLLTVAYNILADRSVAEECVSDTLAEAWHKIPPAKPDNLKAFLTAIVRRRAIDRYRSSRRQREIPQELTVPLYEIEFLVKDETDVFDALEAKELSTHINCFVKGLNSRRRHIFISRYYLSRKIDEIARELSISRSSVNKELSRIKKDLRAKLESEGYSV